MHAAWRTSATAALLCLLLTALLLSATAADEAAAAAPNLALTDATAAAADIDDDVFVIRRKGHRHGRHREASDAAGSSDANDASLTSLPIATVAAVETVPKPQRATSAASVGTPTPTETASGEHISAAPAVALPPTPPPKPRKTKVDTAPSLPRPSVSDDGSKTAPTVANGPQGFLANLWASLTGHTSRAASTMSPQERWASLVFALFVFGGVAICAVWLLFRAMRRAMRHGSRDALSGHPDDAYDNFGGVAGRADADVEVCSVADQVPATTNSSRQRILERVRLANERKAQYGATSLAH